MPVINLKRIYDKYDMSDGYRILVDRLWPRGIKKENSRIDLWLKEIAPSIELRKWFNHEAEKWEEFSKKYTEELNSNCEAATKLLKAINDNTTITLLFGSRDEQYNQATILKNWLDMKADLN